MATPRTGKPRGAPPKQYRTDPDRYAIAFAVALQVAFGASEASAFNLAASMFCGEEVEHEPTGRRQSPAARMRRRQPPGTEAIGWLPLKKPRTAVIALPNKASTLRLKWKRGLSEKDARHFVKLTTACGLALRAKDRQKAILKLRELLNAIGEQEFGERCLVPMILTKSDNPI